MNTSTLSKVMVILFSLLFFGACNVAMATDMPAQEPSQKPAMTKPVKHHKTVHHVKKQCPGKMMKKDGKNT